MKARRAPILRISRALMVALVALLGVPLTALAVYPPGTFPGPAPGGAFRTVVVSQIVCSTGGTIGAPHGTATVTLLIPGGAFADCTQVTIYDADQAVISRLLPTGHVLADAFAVGWDPAGSAAASLTLTVRDPAITAGAIVFETTATGVRKITGVNVSPGSAILTFSSALGFVVATPASVPSASPSGAVAGATSRPGMTPPDTTTVRPGEVGSQVDRTFVLFSTLFILSVLAVAVGARRRYRRSHDRR